MATTRRQFMREMAKVSVCAGCGLKIRPRSARAEKTLEKGSIPPPMIVYGTPWERGRAYARLKKDGIEHFLEKEIYHVFVDKPSSRESLLRYAGDCAKVVKEVSPIVHEELEGMAEGCGLRVEELVLITLHEELHHRSVLPAQCHCTAVAAGPPDTSDGHTYVGQTWDWMESVFGLSSVVEWRRPEGPSVLAYGFPGLWTGAALNSAGLALCWTSADVRNKRLNVRVGLPSYLLIAHLLYQESMENVLEEARRNRHAGWFTFVMGDGEGNLVNIEGSPEGVTIERAKGHLARVEYGTREKTRTPADQPVIPLHPRCRLMYEHLKATAGEIDLQQMQQFFANERYGISLGKATIDMMVFDTTDKVAYLSRGPAYGVDWKRFTFGKTA